MRRITTGIGVLSAIGVLVPLMYGSAHNASATEAYGGSAVHSRTIPEGAKKPKVVEMVIATTLGESIYSRGDSGHYDASKIMMEVETSHVRGFGPTRDGTTNKVTNDVWISA